MLTPDGTYIDAALLADGSKEELDKVRLADLCMMLENINRFCGATNPVLPVAWHCVELSRIFIKRKKKLQALFHEFDEPFISDIPSRVKELFPDIRKFGHSICSNICKKYGVETPVDEEVKEYDRLLGDYESRLFFEKACGEDRFKYVRPCYKTAYTPGLLLQEINKWL